MSILKIAKMGHPCLCQPADPVDDVVAPEVRLIVRDMIDTMEDAAGTGLAAPQVHIPKRIMVYFVSASRNGGEAVPLQALINPKLEVIDEQISYDWEGCLSVPGLTGLVPRPSGVYWSAYDIEGRNVDGEAHGFHARVLQHEYDHLDGLLYPARMDDLTLLMFQDQVKYGIPEKAKKLMEQ